MPVDSPGEAGVSRRRARGAVTAALMGRGRGAKCVKGCKRKGAFPPQLACQDMPLWAFKNIVVEDGQLQGIDWLIFALMP